MAARRDAEELRRDLYRPGADEGALQRYTAVVGRPGRRLAGPAIGIAVVAAVLTGGGVLLAPLLRPPPPDPAVLAADPAVRGASSGPVRFATRAAALDGLPSARMRVTGSGDGIASLDVAPFAEVVTRDSRLTVLVTCTGGDFALQLSSVTQLRSQILPQPLAKAEGRCGGVQRVRYRPLLGLIPTAVRVDAQGPVRVEATIG